MSEENTSVSTIQAIKDYRAKHRCSLQEAIAAVGGPRLDQNAWKADMTPWDTPQGHAEQIIAGLFRRMPDMSGDQRRRLSRHEYDAVKRAAAEIIAIAKAETS